MAVRFQIEMDVSVPAFAHHEVGPEPVRHWRGLAAVLALAADNVPGYTVPVRGADGAPLPAKKFDPAGIRRLGAALPPAPKIAEAWQLRRSVTLRGYEWTCVLQALADAFCALPAAPVAAPAYGVISKGLPALWLRILVERFGGKLRILEQEVPDDEHAGRV